MIVKCEKCQTKFKVGDEQVSAQGTWVRCSKCQNTFQARRSSGAAVGDPFAMFDEPIESEPAGSPSLEDQLFGDLAATEFNPDAAPALESPPAAPRESPDHSLFDMPPPPPRDEVSAEPRELLPPQEELLPPAPPKSRLLGTAAFRQPPQNLRAPPPSSGVRRLIRAVMINIAIAGGLLLALGAVSSIYANDGKLDPSALSVRRLGALFRANRDALAVESWSGFYDTKAGKPVFYIRGEVQNTGAVASKLRVRVEILDGTQLVRSAEILAGTAATPEDLYNIGSSADADALSARLERAAAAVPPGGRVPFLLTFYEYPPNLSGFRIKVTAGALASKQSAAR